MHRDKVWFAICVLEGKTYRCGRIYNTVHASQYSIDSYNNPIITVNSSAIYYNFKSPLQNIKYSNKPNEGGIGRPSVVFVPPVAARAWCGHPVRWIGGPWDTAPERPGSGGGRQAEWERRHAATGRGTLRLWCSRPLSSASGNLFHAHIKKEENNGEGQTLTKSRDMVQRYRADLRLHFLTW